MSVTVVVGGQAGSEGKGAVCGYLHKHRKFDIAVRVGGPNAGHSVVDGKGHKWAFRQLPVGAVIDENVDLVIAAGSEIEVEVLAQEVNECELMGYRIKDRLYIDEQATIITEACKLAELDIETGTTGKGIGGARAIRALRKATRVKDVGALVGELGLIVNTQDFFQWGENEEILLEGTQGYILGSHAGEYPFCTSGDCRAIDFMAACGMPPQNAHVWIVLRMNPIRIAGNSGELANEIAWEDVGGRGVEAEITTVTKKVRRVGGWDPEWAMRSVRANCGTLGVKVALTMVDYHYPELKGKEGILILEDLPARLQQFITEFEQSVGGMAKVRALGTSDRTMIDLVG